MFFRILKKDIFKKKLMNLIILIFIILAGMFLASSVSNLNIALNGIDNYFRLAHIADYTAISSDEETTKKIETYIEKEKIVTDYEILDFSYLDLSNIYKKRESNNKRIDINTIVMACTAPENTNIPLDDNINEITVKEGELYIDHILAKDCKIKVGDTIIFGKNKLQYKVAGTFKDAFLGNSFMGNKRILFHEKDFEKLSEDGQLQQIITINTTDIATLSKNFRSKGFSAITIDKDMLKISYMLDMLSMAVLVAVSVCLIAISMLVLRFTINFTIQGDYKQIGIMKALGFRNYGIKKLYITKYLALSIIGGVLGFMLSFPFGNFMTKNVVSNIIVEKMDSNIWLNLITIIIMVIFICLFCYFCTRKLDSFSVIEAIRNGSESESYGKKSLLSLKNSKKMNPAFFMAWNDILSNKKRYVILLITFLLGIMILIIPMNIISTITSDHMYPWCTGAAAADMYISTDSFTKKIEKIKLKGNKNIFLDTISDLEKKYKKQGVEMRIQGECLLNFSAYGKDEKDSFTFMAIQNIGGNDNQYEAFEGSTLKEENEIMITKKVAEKLEVTVGDTVFLEMKQGYKPFIVSGLFRSMSQLGEQIRISSKLEPDYSRIQGIFDFEAFFKEKENKEENIHLLKEKFPNDKIKTIQEATDAMIGNMTGMMTQVSKMLIILVLGINGLITILMMKTFLTKETGEIALLKSLGFRDRTIETWQVGRITIILVFSVIMGIIISGVAGTQIGYLIFNSMGAYGVKLTVKPLEVYVIYPLLILGVNVIMSIIAYRSMKKVDLVQVTNME